MKMGNRTALGGDEKTGRTGKTAPVFPSWSLPGMLFIALHYGKIASPGPLMGRTWADSLAILLQPVRNFGVFKDPGRTRKASRTVRASDCPLMAKKLRKKLEPHCIRLAQLPLQFSNLTMSPLAPSWESDARPQNPQIPTAMKSSMKFWPAAGLVIFLCPILFSCKTSAATNKHEFKKELHKVERSH